MQASALRSVLARGCACTSVVAVVAVSLATAPAWGNGVNPRKTKENVPVDVECRKKAGRVTIENAFVALADRKDAERAIEFSAQDDDAPSKVYLTDIQQIDIKAPGARDDFAHATLQRVGPSEAKTAGKLRVRKQGKPLFLAGEKEVLLATCKAVTIKSRSSDRREEAPPPPAKR